MGRSKTRKLNSRTAIVQIGQHPMSCLLLSLIILFTLGCSSYYEVNSTYDVYELRNIQKKKDYIILHNPDSAWHFTDIKLDSDKQEVSGKLSPVSPEHEHYTNTTQAKRNRYRFFEGDPTFESHIYASSFVNQKDSTVIVSFSEIERIDIYDEDVGATTSSAVLGATGAVVGTVGVLAIIIALTKSSCPFVYVNDGISYRFVGEMYGGAIYASLEREDYMPVPEFIPIDGAYELKIANKLQERQYTNLAELVLVEHPINSELIIDKYGKALTIIEPEAPISATDSDGSDIIELVLKKDSMNYLFSDSADEPKALSGTTLTFARPADAMTGKLVLNAKNSFWLDYLFGQFTQKFGASLDDFIIKQREASPDKHIQWKLDQGIPLTVSVKNEGIWESIDYFYVVGPLATRDLVMELDLSNIKGESVELKLECGFMFWELDYAAMDFSDALEIETSHLKAHYAVDETGIDVLDEIYEVDDSYLYQPEVGNVALIKYSAPEIDTSRSQTVFLKSQGYYEYIRNYEHKPRYAALKSFRKEGALIEFSKVNYKDFMENLLTDRTVELR